MPPKAIKVDGLSKMYRIGAQQVPYHTLRDSITQAVTAPVRRVSNMLRGRSSSAAELTEEFWALKDISFELEEGEVLGIIGRNGAGKSTLLKILSRITEPTHGTAETHGRVGSLLEVGTGFHPELTGRENIYLNGAILGMPRIEIEQRFDEIVAFAEVEQFIDTPVKHYSSGMRLRLGFAVAAHLEPDILIVDEVLAVGDAAFQKKCLGKMSDVAGAGRTVLFVSHNMAAVKTLCNRGIVLNNGEIVFSGGAIDAVSHYFELGAVSNSKRTWEAQTAPSSKSARLLEVELLSDGIIADGEVSSEKPMQFAISFEVTKDAKVGTSALLYDTNNTLIFASLSNHEADWHLKNRPTGLYQSICSIPANLINDGSYSLTVILWEGFYENSVTEHDVLRFYVHEQGFVRGDYNQQIEGAILPKLNWTSKAL